MEIPQLPPVLLPQLPGCLLSQPAVPPHPTVRDPVPREDRQQPVSPHPPHFGAHEWCLVLLIGASLVHELESISVPVGHSGPLWSCTFTCCASVF